MPMPVPVPALVPVVLLAPLVCDSTNRAENTSPIYTGPSKIYVGHQPRTTVEIPFKIKDISFIIRNIHPKDLSQHI